MAILAGWLFAANALEAAPSEPTTRAAKPRVIVMTDGEIDDHSSMIRFILEVTDDGAPPLVGYQRIIVTPRARVASAGTASRTRLVADQ